MQNETAFTIKRADETIGFYSDLSDETGFDDRARTDEPGFDDRARADETGFDDRARADETIGFDPARADDTGFDDRELNDLDFTISTFIADSAKPSIAISESVEQAAALDLAESRITELENELQSLKERNIILEERGKKLAHELDIFRHRRLVYWSDRFRNKFDAWHLMHPGFEEAKDDTMLFQGDLKGFRLLPSLNLVRLSSLRYELDLGRPGLSEILLAPIVDLPSMVGEICIRITDSKQIVLREVSVPIAKVSEEEPCELKFPSLGEISLNRLNVHIFAQGVDVPVRIFELRKYPRLGFARLQRKLFAGYSFED